MNAFLMLKSKKKIPNILENVVSNLVLGIILVSNMY